MEIDFMPCLGVLNCVSTQAGMLSSHQMKMQPGQHGEASVNAGTRRCNCGMSLIDYFRRRLPSFGPSPPASHKSQESRVESRGGTPALDYLPYLIACRSPSKSITAPLPPSKPHMGQAGRAGQDAISRWAGNTRAAQSRRAPAVPSHVGRLETPGPLRTHRASSQPHYTTGLWPAPGAASPPRHHDDVRPRSTSPSPEEACHAAAALPCPALPTCACVPLCLRALGPRWGRPPRASRPHWHIFAKRKAGIALLSGCIVPTPAPSLASASLRYQQPLYTLLPLL